MSNICKESRVTLGLSQKLFAIKLNRSRRTIIRWEKDQGNIPANAISAITAIESEGAL